MLVEEIAFTCGRSVDEIKKKIHSLRTAFTREVRKERESQSNPPSERYKSTWEFYNALKFTKSSLNDDEKPAFKVSSRK